MSGLQLIGRSSLADVMFGGFFIAGLFSNFSKLHLICYFDLPGQGWAFLSSPL